MNQILIDLPQLIDGEDKSSPFKNTIRKNYRHLRKWAKRTVTDCFRIYDREMHHYPLAIDFYAGRFCVHYFSQDREQIDPPELLMEEVTSTLEALFGPCSNRIYWRNRVKRRQCQQYEKTGVFDESFTVHEYGIKFKVNLLDYLDTGLFLDHRETRRVIGSLSNGKRLLNLFSYTCAFSVHAAMGGALFTKSVDMSNTYTAWGKENFILNGLPLKNHEIVREDCLKFLDQEAYQHLKYDIIVIDPPTISRSKKMTQMFDIQLDYQMLLFKASRLLSKEGVIYFSTNSRRFAFDETLYQTFFILDISDKTIPEDFHDSKIHRCWKISPK